MDSDSQHYLGNLNCPHCRRALCRVVTDVLSDWQGEELLCCFNDECVYTKNSWATMQKQGVPMGYRYYFSESGEGALLIHDKDSYKDKICEWAIEEEVVNADDKEFEDLLKAIDHAEEVARDCENPECAEEHQQLSRWLKQLKKLKYPSEK